MAEFIKVTYTGKEKDTGKIFDTNNKKIAEENKIYNPNLNYKPILMILGKGQLIPGFEEALVKMKTGEQKIVEIPPEKGYGERKPDLVRLVPLQVFKQNKIDPKPGMILQLEGTPARIQSVSGGRVRVDFNHDLAGKILIFDVKVEEKIEKQEDQLKELVKQVFPFEEKIKSKIDGKNVEINVERKSTAMEDYDGRKMILIQQIKTMLDMENVKIIEEH